MSSNWFLLLMTCQITAVAQSLIASSSVFVEVEVVAAVSHHSKL